jgi:5-methylcytosine-specific restriction enzyme subunit McrC
MIKVREYARLSTLPLQAESLDFAVIPASAFQWLMQSAEALRCVRFMQWGGELVLQLQQFVGLIETPCGTQIEILPKIASEVSEAQALRQILLTWLSLSADIPHRVLDPGELQTLNQPVHEWLLGVFLQRLQAVLRQGLRFDYQRHACESRYIRGGLDLSKQLRQLPGRQHRFHIRPDRFDVDNAENRLLRSTLEVVFHRTQDQTQRRTAHELLTLFADVRPSGQVTQDLAAWRTDRLMRHYDGLRGLCELILQDLNPITQVGQWRRVSWLFSMDVLFERVVAHSLREHLPAGYRLRTQMHEQALCDHQGQACFQLRPDLVIEGPQQRWVLDTKWKRLDTQLAPKAHYGLSQQDMYQLFAYGQKYVQGQGDLFLIYPQHAGFQAMLPPFSFQPGLQLWVVPFDVRHRRLVLGAHLFWNEPLRV